MLFKRSLTSVPLALCLSLMIGCSGNETAGPADGAPGPDHLNSAVEQDADEADKVTGETDEPVEQAADNVTQETAKPVPRPSLDLKYITDDFRSAVIVYPARVLSSDFMNELVEAGFPLENELKEVTEGFGLDPRNVEQIVFLLDEMATATAPDLVATLLEPQGEQGGGFGPVEVIDDNRQKPLPTVIIRLSESVDQDQFFDRITAGPLEDGEVDGLQVKMPPSQQIAFRFADAKTLIATNPAYLKKMIDTKSAESDLITELKNIDPKHDLIVVADLTLFRQRLEMIGQLISELIPPEMSALSRIFTQTNMLTLTSGTSHDSLLSLTIVMNSENDANAVNGALTDALKQLRQAYEARKAQGLPADVPFDEEGRKELMAMTGEIVAGISNEAGGRRVTVSIPKPSHFNRLAASMKPAIEQMKKREEMTRQMNNLHQIVIAFHNYSDAHKAFPGAGSDASGKNKGLSWRVHLLPQLGYVELYSKFHLDEPWDSEHNKTLIDEMPGIYKSRGVDDATRTSIHMFVGEKAFPEVGGKSFRDFADGESATILLVEAAPDKAEVWTRPGGLKLDEFDPLSALGKLTEDHFLAAFVDNQVRPISTSIDPKTLKALITINGGERVDDF